MNGPPGAAEVVLSLLPYVLIAMTLIGLLCVFLTLKLDLATTERRQGRQMADIAGRLDQELARRQAASPAAQGWNVSRRVQVLRMLKRGEDVARITEQLDVPRREVELLIRVHHVEAARAARNGSRTRSSALIHPRATNSPED